MIINAKSNLKFEEIRNCKKCSKTYTKDDYWCMVYSPKLTIIGLCDFCRPGSVFSVA